MTRVEIKALYNALALAENGRNTSHPNEGFKQLRELLDIFWEDTCADSIRDSILRNKICSGMPGHYGTTLSDFSGVEENES